MIPKADQNKKSDALTVDYRKIASIPIGTRNRLASSGLASLLASSLTPGQRASLFPRYYLYGDSGVFRTASLGPTDIPSQSRTVGGITTPPLLPSDKKKVTDTNLIPGGLIPGPDGQPMRVPDIQYTKSSKLSSKEEIANYIQKAAIARGIDPNVALGVAQSEGLNSKLPGMQSELANGSNQGYQGREDSWGPFQLYMGSGLGTEFQKKTGLDPRDPNTIQQQIDFALDYAAKNGWRDWHGWTGDPMAGLGPDSKAIGISPINSEGTETTTATPLKSAFSEGVNIEPAATASTVSSADDIGFVSPVSGTFAGTENSDYGDPRGSYSPGGASQHGPKNRKHSGVDWQAPNGSDAVFPVNGTVIHSGRHSGYVTLVDIKGDDGRIYRLAPHGQLAQNFEPGQRVTQGETLGKIAEGHLHMEVIPQKIDGIDNPVYSEFDAALTKGNNGFVSTSNERGTVDPSSELGINKGQQIVAGQSWKPENTATAVAQAKNDTFTLNKEEALKIIKNTDEYKNNPLAKFASDDMLLTSQQFSDELAKHGVKYDPKTNQVSNVDTSSKDYQELVSQYPTLLQPTSDTQTVNMTAQQIVPSPPQDANSITPTPPSPAQAAEEAVVNNPPQAKVAVPLPTQASPSMTDNKKPVTPPSKESNGSVNLAPTVMGASTSITAAYERAKGGWTRGFYDI